MDLWGVGCVMFEITALYPLFPGNNEVDQVWYAVFIALYWTYSLPLFLYYISFDIADTIFITVSSAIIVIMINTYIFTLFIKFITACQNYFTPLHSTSLYFTSLNILYFTFLQVSRIHKILGSPPPEILMGFREKGSSLISLMDFPKQKVWMIDNNTCTHIHIHLYI